MSVAQIASQGGVSGRPLDWVLTDICAVMSADMAEMEAMAAESERQEEELADALADVRRRVRIGGGVYERWGWVPWYGQRLLRDVNAAKARLAEIKSSLAVARRRTDDIRKRLTQASLSYDMLLMLGQRDYCVPDPMPARTRRFLKRFEDARKAGTVKADVYRFAGDLSEILGDWAAASLLFLQSRQKQPAADEESEPRESHLVYDKAKGAFVESTSGYARPLASSHVLHRIYLPIPRSWEGRAVQAGARIDDSTVNHAMSRVWVSFNEYEDFEEYAPKAYRKSPPELDFEELHLRFGGQEFAFDPAQDAALRKRLSARQGSRCVLCGSYGGLVWDWVKDPKASASSEPLVIRPQWRYRRHGETDVGVAELADLLLICRDCDVAFDVERLRALLVGKPEKLVERAMGHLHKRRLMLLRCEDSALALRQAELTAHFGRMASLSAWVLDFTGIPQRFEALADGLIAPETLPVAGIPIISPTGEVLSEAVSLDEAIRRVVSASPEFAGIVPERPAVAPGTEPFVARDDAAAASSNAAPR